MGRAVRTETPLPKTDGVELRPEVTDDLLADITRRIVEAFHPYKVILFGSYAYGTPHVYSDVDLPRIQNLVQLRNQCATYDTRLLRQLPLVRILNPYGIAIRYPGMTATVAQAKEAVRTARSLRRTLRRKLGL